MNGDPKGASDPPTEEELLRALDQISATRKRIWSGGMYPDREGVEVRADGAGITIEPWYDGGIGILSEETVRLTWGELDAMREAARGT